MTGLEPATVRGAETSYWLEPHVVRNWHTVFELREHEETRNWLEPHVAQAEQTALKLPTQGDDWKVRPRLHDVQAEQTVLEVAVQAADWKNPEPQVAQPLQTVLVKAEQAETTKLLAEHEAQNWQVRSLVAEGGRASNWLEPQMV